MNIGHYSFEDYLSLIKSFHGGIAPGMVIGGIMVNFALNHTPEGELFDVLCETSHCLPDAIQLLTPCTVGNGWLKIINLGRFAFTLYEKNNGQGIRVFLDSSKLDDWSEVKSWYLKLKPKKEQDSRLLLEQIKNAGTGFMSLQKVQVRPRFLKKRNKGEIAICPVCGEAYPSADGGICRSCQGEGPYIETDAQKKMPDRPPLFLKKVPVEQAVGNRALHDMTMIIPHQYKGPAFKRGQEITVGDICRLQQMGRQNLFIEQDNSPGAAEWMHEDEAVLDFARAMAGDGVAFDETPNEGKINLFATQDGLLQVDEKRLEMFNLVPDVMCASLKSYSTMKKGRDLAGTRAIPLFIYRDMFEKAMSVLTDGPLFQVLPMRKARVGILVTGGEVFQGLVKDKFIPIISSKVKKFDCKVVRTIILPDDREIICTGIKELAASGIDLLVTTAGLSVDPDDVTRQALIDAGATDMLYGAPVLPGAMTLLARLGNVRVMGVPACGLYFKSTSFDLLLPRLLAGLNISRTDLARLGHGSFCMECKICTFPKCPFGR